MIPLARPYGMCGSITTGRSGDSDHSRTKRKLETFTRRRSKDASSLSGITTAGIATQRAKRFFAQWWTGYFTDKRLNAITVSALEKARQSLLATIVTDAKEHGDITERMTPQRVGCQKLL